MTTKQAIDEELKRFKNTIESYKSQDDVEKLRDVFRQFDKDDNGEINDEEFVQAALSLGQKLTVEQARGIISQMDANDNHTVDFNEFYAWWHNKNNGAGGTPDAKRANNIKMRLERRNFNKFLSQQNQQAQQQQPETEPS